MQTGLNRWEAFAGSVSAAEQVDGPWLYGLLFRIWGQRHVEKITGSGFLFLIRTGGAPGPGIGDALWSR